MMGLAILAFSVLLGLAIDVQLLEQNFAVSIL